MCGFYAVAGGLVPCRGGVGWHRSRCGCGGGSMGKDEQAIGMEEGGRAKAQPSGPGGGNPATAGPGETRVRSETSENAEGRLDPSAPGETGTTPGSNAK